MTTSAGTRLGRYEIRSQIGAGGMGEVYLARDVQLSRPVALKILHPRFVKDDQRLRRFEQEACAASGLNHPNILTIYEIGHTDDAHFIATEFIDGETLRYCMARGQMKISEILDVAVQAAAALAAAHAAGIIHRDIKPENIMRRKDGYVKVLDFGLAKLGERISDEDSFKDWEAPTREWVNTEPGVVVGTVNYMSPEQACGLVVDARTDIWSLGCVLYEMAAGHALFKGPTSNHVIAAIINREPPPFDWRFSEAPETLQWIIAKALRKERDERYQTVKEMLTDLRSLRQKLELADELERSIPPQARGTSAASVGSHATAETNSEPVTQSGASRLTHSAGYLIGEIDRHRKGAALALAACIVAAAFILYGLSKAFDWDRTPMPFNTMKVTRLLITGEARNAIISPDGKYIAHTIEEGGQQSLWIGQTATSSNMQAVVPSAEVRFYGVTFSLDGNYLYYVIKQKNNSIGVLYQVPALGGTPVKLVTDVDSPVTFSPDGTQMAFVRGSSLGERALIVASVDGTGERKLSSRKGNDSYSFEGPAWSPDGQRIACGAGTRSGGQRAAVVEISIKDGTEKPIATHVWGDVGQVAWLTDGSGLVLTASDQWANSPAQLWYLSYPKGETRRITNDLNNYGGVSLTSDSNTLVTVQVDRASNVWVAPAGDASRARQITSSKHDGIDGLFWTPDNNRIVYTSSASGKENLWIVNADSTAGKQLSSRSNIYWWPSVSPDGRYVYFISDLTGARNIWRMEMDGGNMSQLSGGGYERYSQVSPDGQWIVYTSSISGRTTLWKMNADGSNPVQLTDRSSVLPVISPDAKLIACYYRDELKSPWKIALMSPDGGTPIKTFDIPPTVVFPARLGWTPDGRAIAYIEDREGASNIWSQPVDGGKPVQLTNWDSGRLFAFAWSRDGRWLACARGTLTSDVVTLSDFR